MYHIISFKRLELILTFLFLLIALLKYNWHLINCAYLKYRVWSFWYLHIPIKLSSQSRWYTHLSPRSILRLLCNPSCSFSPSSHTCRKLFMATLDSLYFLGFYRHGIAQHILFLFWLLSLSIMILRSSTLDMSIIYSFLLLTSVGKYFVL